MHAHASEPTAGEAALDEWLSRPGAALPLLLEGVPGDLVILGAGGKMGPTLARMARRALDHAGGSPRRVTAVSRWSDAAAARALRDAGVATLARDLADPDAVNALPDAELVVFLAGQKFGTAHDPTRTWMTNVVVPSQCLRRYAGRRIVVLSTGNVYGLTPLAGAGSRESDDPAPAGEYAWSALARERVSAWHAEREGTRVTIVRLFYANALRYGVLTDLADRVWRGEPVDLAMGAVNVIWQGDANRLALAGLAHAATPPCVVNVAGERHPVRWLAEELGHRLGRSPTFRGHEAPDALLADDTRMRTLLGAPEVDVARLLDWTAAWVREGHPLLGKPTHFEARDGAY